MSRSPRTPLPAASHVGLDVAPDADPELAARIAAELGTAPVVGAADFRLCLTAAHLELRPADASRRPVVANLVGGRAGERLARAGTRRESLARAVGLQAGTRTVLDATAGLGGDTALLAWLGAEVTAVERHPVVAALLRDGLRRAALDPRFGPLAGRVRLVVGEARDVLAGGVTPDAVLIDPMFPSGRTALGRGELQMLRELVGDDADADELLAAALAVARRRVVVKRPSRAPALAGRAPDVISRGASTRFDVYLTAAR